MYRRGVQTRVRLPSIFVQNVTIVGRYNTMPCFSNAKKLKVKGHGASSEIERLRRQGIR